MSLCEKLAIPAEAKPVTNSTYCLVRSEKEVVESAAAAAAVLVFFKMELLKLFGAAASWPQEAEQPSFASVTAHVEKQQQ